MAATNTHIIMTTAITITATITMTDQRSLLRLMSWLSPAFPVGAFAYSHGIERAIHDGLIHDRTTLADWLGDLLASGSAWNDAVLLAESWREASTGGDGSDVAELAVAMATTRESHMETTLQGAAFSEAATAWGANSNMPLPYPGRGWCYCCAPIDSARTGANRLSPRVYVQSYTSCGALGSTRSARWRCSIGRVGKQHS
ncbi:MAG: urease accessory UreF family protein [Mesorhizobium sp.]